MAEDRTPRYITLSERADESRRTSMDVGRKKRPSTKRRSHPDPEIAATRAEEILTESQQPHFP